MSSDLTIELIINERISFLFTAGELNDILKVEGIAARHTFLHLCFRLTSLLHIILFLLTKQESFLCTLPLNIKAKILAIK